MFDTNHFIIWHWPHGDVLSYLKITYRVRKTRTPGMTHVEDGTARFLELLEAVWEEIGDYFALHSDFAANCIFPRVSLLLF
ncbi:hypothetical protein Q3G72_014966 [Acer saccharum]|nr:hypothetical protein Q3G72_014966 [Acer saccharum]